MIHKPLASVCQCVFLMKLEGLYRRLSLMVAFWNGYAEKRHSISLAIPEGAQVCDPCEARGPA